MLSLQIKSGEYITIGENVVIQVFQRSGSQFRLAIQAPRELPIVRGEVRERTGAPRPESVGEYFDRQETRKRAKHVRRLAAQRKAAETRADAVQQLRTILDELESLPEVQQAARAQLKRLELAEISMKQGGAAPDGTESSRNYYPQHNHQGAALSHTCTGDAV